MEARKNCCKNFNRDNPCIVLALGGKKVKKIKNGSASSVINVLFEKKEEERDRKKGEYG